VVIRYSLSHNDILTQSDAQEQLLADWVLWQRGRGMSDKTITDRLTIIRRIPDSATPKVKKGRPRPVTDEHLAILLDTRMYRRTRAMILLAAYAGLRVSEIAAIKGDDVDTVMNTITVIGKGDKERQIPLHPILKDLAAGMSRRGWWFPTYIGNTKYLAGGPVLGNSVSSSISNVMDGAGIPSHPTPCATGSAPPSEAGVDSLVIKELMATNP